MSFKKTYSNTLKHIGTCLILVLSMIILDSCLSEIDLDAPESNSDSIAVVARLVYGEPSIARVRITNLANFVDFDLAEPIQGATVTLLDDKGNSLGLREELIQNNNGELVETGNYERFITNEFSVEIGNAYKIRIEIGDNVYESTLETLSDVPKVDNIIFNVLTREELNNAGNIVENSYVQFFLSTPLRATPGSEKVYLKWDFETVYKVIDTALEVLTVPPPTDVCYISEGINNDRITVYNGRESREEILIEEFILEEPLDHRFSLGFYLSVYQQSISQGAYNYWNQINSITDLSGTFFEDPPGKVLGNISNLNDPNEEVFGYFSTIRTDTVRFFVNAAEYRVRAKCPFSAPPDDPAIEDSCYDCMLIRNSTTTKPDYWIE